mmetsp:Transcript_29050/g.75167  ORF Transcript_29050/g.75167 Transcript_29050/m.75167 type:complete len:81 (-) Transcript_29050:325-567(-)
MGACRSLYATLPQQLEIVCDPVAAAERCVLFLVWNPTKAAPQRRVAGRASLPSGYLFKGVFLGEGHRVQGEPAWAYQLCY